MTLKHKGNKNSQIDTVVTIFDSNNNVIRRCEPTVTSIATAHQIGRNLKRELHGSDYTVIRKAKV